MWSCKDVTVLSFFTIPGWPDQYGPVGWKYSYQTLQRNHCTTYVRTTTWVLDMIPKLLKYQFQNEA